MPYKTLSKQESKTKQKPWITKSIIKSIKTKNISYKKFVKTQSKFWFDRYKYYKNTINELITKSKNNHLRNYFKENYSNSQKVWSKINEILPRLRRKQFENIFLNEKGTIVSNHKTTAENSMIILLAILKSYLKTWEKQLTKS